MIVLKGAFGEKVEWWRPIAMNVMCYLNWWLLTPLVLYLGRRYPLDTEHWRTSLRVHAPASVLIPTVYLTLCQITSFSWLRPAAYRPATSSKELLLSIFGNIHLEIVSYWVIVGVQWAVRTFVKTAQMETRLAEARLQALRVQLQPHFLFNTLNAISALVHEDPEAADRMISRLSELLRKTLQSSSRQEVPLRSERELVELYLEIERVRFEDRLEVRWSVPPALEGALVPALVLQPIVENAVRHGIARRRGPGRIDLSAGLTDHTLVLRVENHGPPLARDRVEGVGLSNTRARLQPLHGSLALSDLPDGVAVEVRLPYRLEDGA